MKSAPSCPWPRNARFIETTHTCGLVKITLRPGQSIGHSRRFHNGEGWSYAGATYTHEGDHVLKQWGHGGRDCDGYTRTSGEDTAEMHELAAVEIYGHPGTYRPHWRKARPDECRDQYATASNY